jgi:branched-chain amino acid aminotransferase
VKNIRYELLNRENNVTLPPELGFGQIFTDHVFEMDYSPEKGWHNSVIKPLSKLSVHPAAMFIHYGQAAFEGMKAFKTEDNQIVLFRPDRHFIRLNNSAKRLCMPELDVEFAIHALKELVSIERHWIPNRKGESLYIRPFLFALDTQLGVRPSNTYKFIILLSPVGAYYPEGFKPVKILVQDEYVRTVRKGMGECKTPGNYAASLLAAEIARKQGFTQVLWLDGVEQKYVEEVGTMNIFIHFKDEVATPKLTGGILHGVTRASVIHLLRDWGMTVNERLISMTELIEEYHKGNVLGVFGTGTAAVISSVGEIKYQNELLKFNNGEPEELEVRLFDEMIGFHYGKIADRFGWLQQVPIPVSV